MFTVGNRFGWLDDYKGELLWDVIKPTNITLSKNKKKAFKIYSLWLRNVLNDSQLKIYWFQFNVNPTVQNYTTFKIEIPIVFCLGANIQKPL